MINRRNLIAGGLSSLATPTYSQFANFLVAAPSVGGSGGSFGTPKLQISGVFATGNRTRNAKDYYTPSNESPAISTAEYYHMHACQFLRPWDLDAMGSSGATVKAANGNNRYVWIIAGEHPEGGASIHADSWGFKIGFSNDPGILPSVFVDIIPSNNRWTGDATTPGAIGETLRSDMAPSSLVYNPDDATHPFYLYTQGVSFSVGGTQSIVWKSSDLFDWIGCAWGPKNNFASTTGGLTSYQLVTRNGTRDWSTFGIVGNIGYMGPGKWISTDGKTWTYASTIYNITGHSTVNLSIDSSSGTPNRLTSSSAIFSPSDDGKGAVLYDGASDPNHYSILYKLVYISATQVNIVGQYGSPNFYTFTNEAAPFEFGPIAYRKAPPPDRTAALGGISAFGPLGAWGYPFTPGDSSQLYQTVVEDARHDFQVFDDGMWVSLAPIDANYNVDQVVPAIRVSYQYDGFYPGPNYLQGAIDYREDGLIHIYTECGYPGPHGTATQPYVGATVTGGVSGSIFDVDSVAGYIPLGAYVAGSSNVGQITGQISGTPGGVGQYSVENIYGVTIAAHTRNILVNSGNYGISSSASNGYFGHQFIDYYTVAIASLAASRAAPFGVSASCGTNTVTISWMTTPLGTGAESQSYNVYRGSTSGSQATFVGSTSSKSITDMPTPGQVWWYKVVKVSNGVEYPSKNRVVHTYVG